MNPRFPLYIVSKGRWESRYTARHLEAMGVPYHIIVEEQERAAYEAVIGPLGRVLILDPEYQRTYDAFWELEPHQSRGSGPARNFAWDHSIAAGAEWHWCMDDNIQGFFRFNKNLKVPVSDGTLFRCMEDFVLRYVNVAIAGPNYFMFAERKSLRPPFMLNTRIFSCNLIRNDVPLRWRGRYNEDADLSIRALKAGWCTVQFNAFLQCKMPTQTMKGGNTDEIYKGGTADKSRMLVEMHPDVVTLMERYGRAHHFIRYGALRDNQLVRRPGLEVPAGVDNYGMALRAATPSERAGP